MTIVLSQPARLKFEQALDQYQHWQTAQGLDKKPELQSLMDGGRSNTSVLASADDRQFVMRLDGVNPQRLGLNRSAEWRTQQAAHEVELAPAPVYFNPELGILVSEFQQQHPLQVDELQALADLLRGIHQLPTVHFRLQLLDRARRYLGHLKETIDPEMEALGTHLRHTGSRCLCHNDLLRANRLSGGDRLLAIDWEYTATGDPLFDLAVICEGDGLSDSDSARLLSLYLHNEETAEQRQHLADLRGFYRYLSTLWERLTEP